MKAIILTVSLLFPAILAYTQDTPEQIIEKFFQDYEEGAPATALDNLYANLPWSDRIQDDIEKLKMQFTGLQSLVGAYIGYDLITQKSMADRLSIYSYLVRFERQPVRFVFEFYRPKDKWGLYGFSYDDNLDEELEEVIKLQYLYLDK